MGVFVSTNKGRKWELFSKGLTTATVHDLVIQPEENHLLVGTHGRSIFKADISVLQKKKQGDLTLFSLKEIKKSKRWGSAGSHWGSVYEPSVELVAYSRKDNAYSLKIKDAKGVVVHQADGQLTAGYNYIRYDLTIQETFLKTYQKKYRNNPLKSAKNGKHYLPKETYTIELTTPESNQSTSLTIK